MMVAKARLFGDEEAVARVLATSDPGEAKQAGRKARGFDEHVWKSRRSEIVIQGSLAKFGQNPALASFLLSLAEDLLVEASPVDRIWGIGLAAGNPDARNPVRWRGLNLLGFALTVVRDRLRQEQSGGSNSG